MAEAAPSRGRSVRVLVVDDNELFADTMAWMLDQHDRIEVVGRAVNGRVAVRLVPALRPDVVLMDLDMPVLDGIAATEEIAGAARVVILTASAGRGDADRAEAAGAAAFLTKDQSVEEVAEAVLAAAA